MASSTKQFSLFLFLLVTLLSSLHIHARESQFFSKVTNTPKENEIPTNKEVPLKNEQQQQEQEPNFIPQGQDGGYGLYGHESGELPPATTTTTTTGVEPYFNSNNNEAYVTRPQGMSDTRFMEKGYTTPINGNMYNPEKQGEGTTMGEANNYYNGENNMYNQEKQGMSDTRFMDKGYTTPVNSGVNMYNPEKQGEGTTMGEANNYYNGETNMYNQEKQGMSDTRFMEKGYTTPINGDEYNNDGNTKMYNQEKQGMSDTRFMKKGYTTYNNGGNMYNPEKQGERTTAGEANNYYNGESNMYNQEKQGMSDTRFMDKGYTTPINSGVNMYNPEKQGEGTTMGEVNNYYNGGNTKMYNPEKQGISDTRFMEKGQTTPIDSYNNNNGGNMYNPEKQGMSDTRFLENGKYYYDLNSKNYNSLNANDNSRGVDSRYESNSRGNYGNNGNSYDLNNNNGNSMEFQNEEDLP